jgi:hypothetical protein
MNKIILQLAIMGRVWHHNSISQPLFIFSMEYAQPKSRTTIFYVQPVLGITLTQRYVKGGHMDMDTDTDTSSPMLTLTPMLSLHQQGSQKMIQFMKKLNGVKSKYLT